MDHLDVAKAHVVGYSPGGIIAMKVMIGHPGRVLSGTLGGMGWRGAPELHLQAAVQDRCRGLDRRERAVTERYSSRGTLSRCRIDRPFTMKMTISAMFVA
jgi:hypothetical protein